MGTVTLCDVEEEIAMPRAKVTNRKLTPELIDDLDAFSIAEFCRRNSISVAMFYKLKQAGQAPKTFYVGVRQLISRESAADWRREREAANAAIENA
jgi:hypothetical protein